MEFRNLTNLLIERKCNGFAAAYEAKQLQCRSLPLEVAGLAAN